MTMTMFDVPLSMQMVGWISVVLFHAIVHFGIIGPRIRKRQAEREEAESDHENDEIVEVELLDERVHPEMAKMLSQTGTEWINVSPLVDLLRKVMFALTDIL